MTRGTLILGSGLFLLASVGEVVAGEDPVAVSPGNVTKLAVVESRCPTFSWAEVEGARSYEIVVYELDEESEEARVVFRQNLPAPVYTWTPGVEQCLERGGRYAWSVRAEGRTGASGWSAPRLFQVAAGSSEADLEAAMAALRSDLEAVTEKTAAKLELEGESAPEVFALGESLGTRVAASAGTKLSVDGNVDATSFSGDGSMLTDLAPENLASGTAAINISGTAANVTGTVAVAGGGTGATDAAGARTNLGVAAAEALANHAGSAVAHHIPPTALPPTGAAGGALAGAYPNPMLGAGAVGSAEIADGSVTEADLAFDPATQIEVGALLTAIEALQDRFDCPGAAFSSGGRFVDCGNGTIRDMNTGVIWLKDASCGDLPGTDVNGQASWADAKVAAASLKDGICGLTDGSLPGQWRLPEVGEFCSSGAGAPTIGLCPTASTADSLVNTNFSSPVLSNASGAAKWEHDGDAFTGVMSTLYWSSTVSGPNAWFVNLASGNVDNGTQSFAMFVWPVRGGR